MLGIEMQLDVIAKQLAFLVFTSHVLMACAITAVTFYMVDVSAERKRQRLERVRQLQEKLGR